MNRAQYIKFRQLNLLGEVAYAYFLEFGTPISVEEFNQKFQIFYLHHRHLNWNYLWEYYDNKFELILLLDKKGKIIKVF